MSKVTSIGKGIDNLIVSILLKSNNNVSKYLSERNFEIIDALVSALIENNFSLTDDLLRVKMKLKSYEIQDYAPMLFFSINDFKFINRHPNDSNWKQLTAEGYIVSRIGSKRYFVEAKRKQIKKILTETAKFLIPVTISLYALYFSKKN